MVSRQASCSCGNLQVTCEGEPRMVIACHCLDCQRRTGSVFGVSAYFGQGQVNPQPRMVIACHCLDCQRRTGSVFGVSAYFGQGQVNPSGASKIFVRHGQDGRKLRAHFCPDCGTSVYWEPDFLPGHIGVAVGGFADPHFPAPTISAREQSRHSWLTFDHSPKRMERQRR